MYFLLFISITKAIQREELYKYQVEQMITQYNEDFILAQNPFMIRIEDQQQLQIFDKLGLIRQTNHSFDKIIAIKQNEFQNQDYIWILYRKGNQTILSKQSIIESYSENYYLQLNHECYTFYFITQYQIVIDCKNQISNIIILFDIENNLQQSFFHSLYKQSKLRQLLKAKQQNLLIFIQQELFLKIYYQSNQFQVCDQLTYLNDAHTAYTYSNELVLISEQWIDIFLVQINYQITLIKREDLKNLPLENKNTILFYYNNFQYQNIFIVESNRIIICNQLCEAVELNFTPLVIREQQNYLIVQTIQNIIIICMLHRKTFTFDIKFQNELVIVNRKLEEFYIINDSELNFYGSTQIAYYRIKNKRVAICQGKILGDYEQSQQLDNILFDDNFQFKNYGTLKIDQNQFLLTGGFLDINFQVEDKYQKQIKVNLSYFLKKEYQNMQYFYFNIQNLFFRKDSIIIFENQTIFLTKFNNSEKYQFDINELQFFKLIQSFDQGYLMQDIRNGVKYIMRINEKLTIDLIQIGCRYNLTVLTCYYYDCICLSDTQIVIQQIGQSVESLQLSKNPGQRFLAIDYSNKISYLTKDNQLIIKYYNVLYNEIHNYSIIMCTPFIQLVVFQFKLIIICTDQMILYNKISDYRYVYSGNIEMYDQQFITSSQVISSDDYLFYVIEDQILHVFNSKLPLSQIYVTKMRIDQYDTVKSFNNHICFQYKNNLQCYLFQINIKFNYDDDQVDYHQVFKVNVCGENKYNRICKEYNTRLDQQTSKISIKQNRYLLTIGKNTNQIILDNRYFTGSIDKIQINKHQIKPKRQLQAFAHINPTLSSTIYYGSYNNLIFIINNQSLSVYDIEKKSIKNIITIKPMRQVLQYKNNQLLIGYNCISVINYDSSSELISLKQNLNILGYYYIYNNILFMSNQSSLISYDLDNLIKNGSFQPIVEEININMVDISQDTYGKMCMVYINQKFELVFKYFKKIKIYKILESFRQQGVDLKYIHMDIIYSMKLLNDCKLLYVNTIFGTYFLDLATQLIFLAQIVVKKSSNIHQSQLLIGDNYLYYVQQFPQYISIYKFTYHQIYNYKFIELHIQIYKQTRQFSYKDNYFHVYNDQLYLAQTDSWKLFIFIINPEIIIQMDQNISNQEKIIINLSNTDENKSFILEIVVEDSNSFLYWIFLVILLLIYHIWLINRQVYKRK